MTSIDQRLTDAAIRYLDLLGAGTPVSIHTFVQSFEPAIREELATYLQFVLESGEPIGSSQLTPEELAIVARSRQRRGERITSRLGFTPTSLTAVRNDRRISTGRLASMINVPAEVMLRIERGGVLIASMPDLLITRLAEALGAAEAQMRAILATPLTTATTRLSAQDGTTVSEETPITFAEAMARSRATAQQRAEWGIEQDS